jgi:hypothetical protein
LKKNWQNITHLGQCPSIDKLVLYHQDKLSKEDSFTIENHLAECEICNDLLEGIAGLKDVESLKNIENELKQRLNESLFKKKSKQRILPVYRRLAIAASILIIIGISIILYLNNVSPVKQVAQSLPNSVTPPKEEYASKPEIKQKEIPVISHAETRKLSAPLNAKKENKGEAVAEFKPEAGSGANVTDQTYSASATDSIISNEPLAVVTEKELPEKERDMAGKIYYDLAKDKKAKIEYTKSPGEDRNTINGMVTDENGVALPGVSVVIKGTTTAAVTDVNGKFSILTHNPNVELQFSYVGYRQEELAVNDNYKENIKVSLKEDVVALNEVVVVGYGVEKRSELTGSVSSANMEDKSEDKKGISVKASRKRISGVYITDQNETKRQIDSLENILKTNKNDKNLIKSLCEKYLELQNKKEALEKLNDLKDQTTDNDQKRIIADVINLTTEGKYDKALKKLKKLN